MTYSDHLLKNMNLNLYQIAHLMKLWPYRGHIHGTISTINTDKLKIQVCVYMLLQRWGCDENKIIL